MKKFLSFKIVLILTPFAATNRVVVVTTLGFNFFLNFFISYVLSAYIYIYIQRCICIQTCELLRGNKLHWVNYNQVFHSSLVEVRELIDEGLGQCKLFEARISEYCNQSISAPSNSLWLLCSLVRMDGLLIRNYL